MAKQLITVPLDKIKAAENNIRSDVDTDLASLAKSIAAVGILEPPLVTGNNGHYDLIAGHRRIAAVHLANKTLGTKITHVDVLHNDAELSEGDRLVQMLIENLQREDITPIDEALGYLRLTGEHGWKQTDIAETVGRNKSHISRRLRLLQLPAEVQEDLVNNKLTLETAITLTELPNDVVIAIRDEEYDEYAVSDELRRAEHQKAEARRVKEAQIKYPALVVTANRSSVEVPEGQRMIHLGWIASDQDLPEGTTILELASGGFRCYTIGDAPTPADAAAEEKAEATIYVDPMKVSAAVTRERTAHENAVLADIAMRPKVAWFKEMAIEAGVRRAASSMIAGRVVRILELEPLKTEISKWSAKEKANVTVEVNDYPATVKAWAAQSEKAAMQVSILGWRLYDSYLATDSIAAADKELGFVPFNETAARKQAEKDLLAKEKARLAKEKAKAAE